VILSLPKCLLCHDAGRNLAQLPVDARVGKLLLLGASLGCLAPALTIAACLSYKSPFSAPFEQQDAAARAKQGFAAAGVPCDARAVRCMLCAALCTLCAVRTVRCGLCAVCCALRAVSCALWLERSVTCGPVSIGPLVAAVSSSRVWAIPVELKSLSRPRELRKTMVALRCAGSGNVASGQQSDHLLMVAAFNGWQDALAQVRATAGVALMIFSRTSPRAAFARLCWMHHLSGLHSSRSMSPCRDHLLLADVVAHR
jgi:HrpA-like RNA helicase